MNNGEIYTRGFDGKLRDRFGNIIQEQPIQNNTMYSNNNGMIGNNGYIGGQPQTYQQPQNQQMQPNIYDNTLIGGGMIGGQTNQQSVMYTQNNSNTLYNMQNQNQQPLNGYQSPLGSLTTMNQVNTSSYNGIMVDHNWESPNLLQLEDPNFIINNTDRAGKVLDNNILTNTTLSLLHVMKSDQSLSDNKSIRFELNLNGNLWGLDFKMSSNHMWKVRRVYIEPIRFDSGMNPLITRIEDLLSPTNRRSSEYSMGTYNAVSKVTSYNTVFNEIVSKTNCTMTDAAKLYIQSIYAAMAFVEQSLLSENCLKRTPQGYVMSRSLYEVLTNGAISVAGINIRPLISVNASGSLDVSAQFDFVEEVSVKFKGDIEYVADIQYKPAK